MRRDEDAIKPKIDVVSEVNKRPAKALEAIQIVNVMEEDHKTSAEHIWEYKTETKTPKCTQLSKFMQMKNQHGEIESLKALEN